MVPDPEHVSGSDDREQEVEIIPHAVHLEDIFSVCVSETTKDLILGGAVFT